MEKRILHIKITEDRVYFNPTLSIPFSQTNLPYEVMGFNPVRIYFWELEMKSYSADKQELYVKVLNYNAIGGDFFDNQVPKKPVSILAFETPLDWEQLEPQLARYTKSAIGHFVTNMIEAKETVSKTPPKDNLEPGRYTSTINVSFRVDFADATFKLGYVSFQKYVTELSRELEFNITNDHLLPEFDLIKHWFVKKLGTREFKVNANIHLANGEVESIQTVSKEIAKITADMIDSVKRQRTMNLCKPPTVVQPDKSLFTSDDIFDQLNDDSGLQGNVFHQTEKDIIELMLADKRIRNRQQLVYLSGAKQSEKDKMRFTLNPHFGFLFLITGERCHHFVWELLNSHATYIWSIDKNGQSLQLQYQRIEQIINTIRSSGREAYRNAYRIQPLDNDLLFNVLEHVHASSALVDGFPKWKHRLNEMLV